MFMHSSSSVHLAPNRSSVGLQMSATEVYEEEMAHFEASLDEHVVHYLKNHPEFYDKHNIMRSRPGVYNLDGREISVDWHFPDNPAQQGYLVVVDGGIPQPFSDYVQGRKVTRPMAAPAPAPAQSSVQQAGNAQTHGSPMYCANHNSTQKRKKTQPRNLPCTRCRNSIQTNYVDFQVCPACSEAEQLCMCCGRPAAGCGSNAVGQNAAYGYQSPTKMQQSSSPGLAMFSPNPMAPLSPMACSPQNRATSFMSASPQHMAYRGTSPMGGDLMSSRRFF